MRIFVIGTGRCGTVTFSKACEHITNYTSEHETTTHGKLGNNFEFPDNHIEIDPRLSYFVPTLRELYPDALFIHLQRERESCIESLSKRHSLIWFSQFHLGSKPEDMKQIASIYYDNTNAMIEKVLEDKIPIVSTFGLKATSRPYKYWHISLEYIIEDFNTFWSIINAKGNKEKALSELKIKYNKS